MKNKKLFAILTLVCFLFTLMPVAAWADGEDTVILKVDSKNVYKNGEVLITDVAPTIVDGRTIVPVRIIIDAMGGEVLWDNDTRTVTIIIADKVMKLVIDQEIPGYGTGAIIIDGRTMVPIRYISEYVGMNVDWVESTRQIIISAEEEVVEYTVTFDLNTSGEGVIDTVTVQDGQTVDKPEIEYKNGKVFHGWYTNDEGKGEPFDFSTPIYSDLVLYGHWSAVTYSKHVCSFEWTYNGDETHTGVCVCGEEVTESCDCDYISHNNGKHDKVCNICDEIIEKDEECKYENGECKHCEYRPVDEWDGAVDTSWYNDTDTEFTLTTSKQLAGLAQLVDGGNDFVGKTINLNSNLNLNYVPEGATESACFDPIGSYRNDTPFKGIFDGQGFTIENMSQNTWALNNGYYYGDLGMGLFGKVEDATIKNLNMDNASISGESGLCGTVAAVADGDCTFENITVTNSEVADYQYYAGGIVGWASGNHQYINCNVEASTTIAAQWGDFNNAVGGVIGGAGGSATILLKDCNVSCRIDAYNDVTSSYQWYAYRRCGMLIGDSGATKNVDGTTYADAPQLTCDNVTVTYDDWANYTYCEFAGTSWPYVRVQAGVSNAAYSNPRYGHPTDANGNEVINDNHVHNDGEDHFIECTFDQLYGGPCGDRYHCYGTATHDGVTVVYNNK